MEKFSFSQLKIEKVKSICISVFNIGGCLVSCLIFRLFLMLDP